MLGNEKVHAYQDQSRKENKPNFMTLTIVSQKFSRIANAIAEPKIGRVTDVSVTTVGQISPESFDVTKSTKFAS